MANFFLPSGNFASWGPLTTGVFRPKPLSPWRGFTQVGMPETSVQGFRGGDVPPTASARAAALSRDAEGDTE